MTFGSPECSVTNGRGFGFSEDTPDSASSTSTSTTSTSTTIGFAKSTTNFAPNNGGFAKSTTNFAPDNGRNGFPAHLFNVIPKLRVLAAPSGEFWGTLGSKLCRPAHHFCDVVDRLHCKLMPSILLLFVLFISSIDIITKNNSTIKCLEPIDRERNENVKAAYDFAVEICNTKNTYAVPVDEGIPWNTHERRRIEIGYYHWVPIALIFQAIFFYAPLVFWKHMNRLTGADFDDILGTARHIYETKLSDDERKTLTRDLSEKVHQTCGLNGSFISSAYLVTKIMCFINVTAQYFFLNLFIGRDFSFWGYDVLKALITGEPWQDSTVFPRQVLCDVPIRLIGDNSQLTLQCHLLINTYLEKFYFFTWWVLFFLLIIITINIFYYIFILFLEPLFFCCICATEHLMAKYLYGYDELQVLSGPKNQIREFVRQKVGLDGILLLSFITNHGGLTLARSICTYSFEQFSNSRNRGHITSSPSDLEKGILFPSPSPSNSPFDKNKVKMV